MLIVLVAGAGDSVIPHAFVAVPPHYRVFVLPKLTDPYGFEEDRMLWPGLFCRKKPAGGQYKVLEGESVHVVGDIIEMGWYGYYWSPGVMRFEAVLILRYRAQTRPLSPRERGVIRLTARHESSIVVTKGTTSSYGGVLCLKLVSES